MTKDVCSICYEPDDIIKPEELRKKRDLGSKNPLLICRFCFDANIEVPCLGGRTSMTQKKDQRSESKKKELENNVKAGRKKARKV